MSYSALTTIKTVVNHFSTIGDTYMTDEEKLKSIRLNINFITQYPDLFDNVMQGPTDIFFGMAVRAKSRALETEYNLWDISEEEQKQLDDFNPIRAFEELASFWRMMRAARNTIIPYVPLELVKAVKTDTYLPVIAFKTRFGKIPADGFNASPVLL